MANKNESIVFYKSFYEATAKLEAEEYKAVMMALFGYAFEGKEPKESDLSGVAAGFFTLMKPQVDANERKRENGAKGAEHGKKGGRPKNPKETPNTGNENPKETPSKPLRGFEDAEEKTPNVNVNTNANANVNANANANGNENAKGECKAKQKDCVPIVPIILSDGTAWTPTSNELESYRARYPCLIPEVELEYIANYMQRVPEARVPRSNIRAYVNSWMRNENKDIAETEGAAEMNKIVKGVFNT